VLRPGFSKGPASVAAVAAAVAIGLGSFIDGAFIPIAAAAADAAAANAAAADAASAAGVSNQRLLLKLIVLPLRFYRN
jgi:hypothetical protein